MHTGGLGCHLALIALGHTSLALADQAISVGHAAIVLSQWLHLMACLALLHNIKGACMHMRLTFIHSSIHSFIHSFNHTLSKLDLFLAQGPALHWPKELNNRTVTMLLVSAILCCILPQMLPSQALKL